LPTAFPSVGAPSLLDFVVTKGVVGVSKPIVINDLSSDHNPISFEIPTTFVEMSPELKIRNFKKANWKKFRTIIVSELETCKKTASYSLHSIDDIDYHIETFISIVTEATNKAIPLKSPYVFRYPHSQLIQDLKSRRNTFRKNIDICPNLKIHVNDLNRQIRLETKKLNMFSWNEKLASVKIEDSSFFQFTKSIKKKHSPVPPMKVTNCSDFVFGAREKADLIASAFLKSHQISQDPTCHSQEVQDSKLFIDRHLPDPSKMEKILIDEVKSSIKQLKVKKAPGHDEISNRVLQNLPACGIEFLTEIYNACLKTFYFPVCWKIGKVVAIPKPGKDHSLPGSYRPITFLPTIGKMLEKMILNRMLAFETENQVLLNQQFGFRAKHSTTQQILRITESIALRFNENKSTAMTLLDIEKAFDSVWHKALVHKLKLNNFPMYLVKMIVSFLESRESYVAINRKNSDRYAIPAGVPQGSPLSPFLFNIFINDIPVPKHCKIAIYADDTALISSIKNYDLPTLVERMDSGLKEIESHFSSWKIKLNSAKTESIFFTKSTIMQKKLDLTRIKINDEELEWKNSVKYLGVVLDSKLTFKANLSENHLKSRKAMAILYCLLKRNSTLGLREKVTLYRSYIRPIMTYACPVFANCADCHMRRLQVLQNKCLRMVPNAHFRTRISSLHHKTGIPMIKSFVNKLTESFYKKSSYSENKLVSRLCDYSRQSNLIRPKHRLPRPA
jgi:Reverse transcriptase (RNA-dependent DNA polymerase)